MLNVTAAIIKQDDKILICQRAKDDDAALLWEFPGGKLEEGESLEECILREIKEELALDIAVIGIFAESDYHYGGREVHFTFYEAEILSGTISCNVHETIDWVSAKALRDYDFLPADLPIIELLLKEKTI